MDNEKEMYVRPAVVDYGAVRELTKQGGVPNADIPNGPANTAYPPGS